MCFLIITSFFLAWRLFSLVDFYAVNLLFLDQWDYYDAFFYNHNLWEIFTWQHGPRLGVGLLLTKIVADLSHWNTRAESFAIFGVLCSATILAFYLKARLFGTLTWLDVAIPLLFLTPIQHGTLLHTPNLAHGPVPLFLLLLYCFAWLLRSPLIRYPAVLLLNFLLLYTGFGLFVGLITPVLLTVEFFRFRPEMKLRALLPLIAVLLVSVLSLASYFIGNTSIIGGAKPTFMGKINWPSPRFMALALANVCGVKGVGIIPSAVGAIVGVLVIMICYRHFRQIRGSDSRSRDISLAVVILSSYSLAFVIGLSSGRQQLGLGFAQTSRYTTYLIPAFFALYLHILSVRSAKFRKFAAIAFVVVLVAASFPLRKEDAGTMSSISYRKKVWRDAYFMTGDVFAANRLSGLRIHPFPSRSKVEQKLEYLKSRRLNLYLDAPEGNSLRKNRG